MKFFLSKRPLQYHNKKKEGKGKGEEIKKSGQSAIKSQKTSGIDNALTFQFGN